VKVRNPKAEVRKKAETRSPNAKFTRRLFVLAAAAGDNRAPQSLWPWAFGSRISAFFRVLFAALSLLATQHIFATVTNTPAPDEIPALRPPHAEIAPSFWDQYGLWIILCGVLLLALVCAAVWFLTRSKPPVVVPPELQARQALEPLRQQPEDGALLSRVSQILRHYLTAAFSLPPGELTTAECCRAIAGHGQIGPELSAALSDFLRQCDQRKFSPPPPAPPLSAVARALKLIEQAQARRAALAQTAAQPTQSSVANPPKTGIEQ